VTDSPNTAAPSWKDVPGDDYRVSTGVQIMGGRDYTLPPRIESRVLTAILPDGESVVASLHAGRVDVSLSGSNTMKLGFGTPTKPFLALTRSLLLLFYPFQSGSHSVRQYLELPLDAEVSLSPYERGRFVLSWNEGSQLDVLSESQPLHFSRSGPIKEFYAALSERVRPGRDRQ
jgi:hypothetical protein